MRDAVASGRLVKPERCEACGQDPGVGHDGRSLLQAHHRDYARPLDVVWLCATTRHPEVHRKEEADEHRPAA